MRSKPFGDRVEALQERRLGSRLGRRQPGHRGDPDLEREDEPLAHRRRVGLLALEPHGDEARAQRAGELVGRERRGGGEQLAGAVEVVGDHALGEVAAAAAGRAGQQQAGRGVEVDAVRRVQLDRPAVPENAVGATP